MAFCEGEVLSLFLSKGLRNLIGLLAWGWAILGFLLGYFGGHQPDLHPLLGQEPLPPPPILTLVGVTLGAPQAGNHESVQSGFLQALYRRSDDLGANPDADFTGTGDVPYINIEEDGKYRFSYASDHGMREEQRDVNGVVTGSYSYINPDGEEVKVGYTADSKKGFSIQPSANLPPAFFPQPPKDTPEVEQAKQEFFRRFDAEKAAHEASHEKSESPAEIIERKDVQVGEVEEEAYKDTWDDSLETDVIQASDVKPIGKSEIKTEVPVKDGLLPAYFYYVSNSGVPYYKFGVAPQTLPGSPSAFTDVEPQSYSMRAVQAGAQPSDGRHDAQIPRYGPVVEAENQQNVEEEVIQAQLPVYMEVPTAPENLNAYEPPTFSNPILLYNYNFNGKNYNVLTPLAPPTTIEIDEPAPKNTKKAGETPEDSLMVYTPFYPFPFYGYYGVPIAFPNTAGIQTSS